MDKIQFEKNYYNEFGLPFTPIKTKNFLIYQIGDTFFLYKDEIREHVQKFDLEFTFVEKGSATAYADDSATPIRKGDVFVSLKGERHKIEVPSAFRFYYFAVNVPDNSRYKKIAEKIAERCLKSGRAVKLPQLFYVATDILTESLYPDEFSKIVMDNCISRLLVAFYRLQNRNIRSLNVKDNFIYEVMNDVDKNFLLYDTVEKLAENLGYSAGTISALFKNGTGQTLKKYLTAKRLSYAAESLSSGASVSDVSEILNYSSPYNFSKAYKLFFGFSPARTKATFTRKNIVEK